MKARRSLPSVPLHLLLCVYASCFIAVNNAISVPSLAPSPIWGSGWSSNGSPTPAKTPDDGSPAKDEDNDEEKEREGKKKKVRRIKKKRRKEMDSGIEEEIESALPPASALEPSAVSNEPDTKEEQPRPTTNHTLLHEKRKKKRRVKKVHQKKVADFTPVPPIGVIIGKSDKKEEEEAAQTDASPTRKKKKHRVKVRRLKSENASASEIEAEEASKKTSRKKQRKKKRRRQKKETFDEPSTLEDGSAVLDDNYETKEEGSLAVVVNVDVAEKVDDGTIAAEKKQEDEPTKRKKKRRIRRKKKEVADIVDDREEKLASETKAGKPEPVEVAVAQPEPEVETDEIKTELPEEVIEVEEAQTVPIESNEDDDEEYVESKTEAIVVEATDDTPQAEVPVVEDASQEATAVEATVAEVAAEELRLEEDVEGLSGLEQENVPTEAAVEDNHVEILEQEVVRLDQEVAGLEQEVAILEEEAIKSEQEVATMESLEADIKVSETATVQEIEETAEESEETEGESDETKEESENVEALCLPVEPEQAMIVEMGDSEEAKEGSLDIAKESGETTEKSDKSGEEPSGILVANGANIENERDGTGIESLAEVTKEVNHGESAELSSEAEAEETEEESDAVTDELPSGQEPEPLAVDRESKLEDVSESKGSSEALSTEDEQVETDVDLAASRDKVDKDEEEVAGVDEEATASLQTAVESAAFDERIEGGQSEHESGDNDVVHAEEESAEEEGGVAEAPVEAAAPLEKAIGDDRIPVDDGDHEIEAVEARVADGNGVEFVGKATNVSGVYEEESPAVEGENVAIPSEFIENMNTASENELVDQAQLSSTNGAINETVIETDVQSLKASQDDDSDITVSVVTWNLAELSPSEEGASFIRRFRRSPKTSFTRGTNKRRRDQGGSDIVFISAQECENVKPRRAEGHRSREFRRLMIKMLGKKYVPLALHSLGGVQFGLFCKGEILGEIEFCSVADVACGIGNVFHNKGSIAAFVQMRARGREGAKKGDEQDNTPRAKSIRMLFLTAHMAAHVKNTEARNMDFWRVISELEAQAPPRFLKPKHFPYGEDEDEAKSTGLHLMDSMDRIFLCGDLNYRVDLPREIAEYTVSEMCRHIEESETNSDDEAGRKAEELRLELLRHDQLLQTIAAGHAFPNFAEGKITFPPTFKFDKGTTVYDTSHKQRIPAWTDRVLFKPSGTRLLEYDSVRDATHSDHRPVFATFRVNMLGKALRGREGQKRTRKRKKKTSNEGKRDEQ